MKSYKNRKAFTIVEMVIVIAVIAILAAAMIPAVSGVIRQANISADRQFAASLNIQLAMESVDREIQNENDLKDVINKFYGADYFETQLSPKSAKHGYYFWYDYTNKTVTVGTVEEIADLAAHTPTAPTMSAVPMIGGGKGTFSPASLRSDLIPGYYLLGCKGGDLVDLIAKFESMTDGQDYQDISNAVKEMQTKLADELAGKSEDELKDKRAYKATVDALVGKVEKTVIFNGHHFFLPVNETAENVEGYPIWTPTSVAVNVEEAVSDGEVKVYQYKDGEVSDTSRENAFPVKGGEFSVHGGINTLKALSGLFKMPGTETGKVTMHLDVTLEALKGMAMPDDTDYVIALPDGNKYVIEGTVVVNIDTGVREDLDQSTIEEVLKDYTVEIAYENTGNPGTDAEDFNSNTLYLAWDFGSVESPLAKNIPNSLVEWTVSGDAPIEVNKGAITLKESATRDALKSTATVKVALKSDTTNSDSINIQLVFPLEVEWSIENGTINNNKVELNYTGSNTFAITPGNVVYVASGNAFVKLENEPITTFTAGEGTLFSVTGTTLTLAPEKIADNAQELTVTYGDYVTQTCTVTAKDNSSVGLEKNQITSKNYLFRVGNGNAFTLGKLFSAVAEGKAVKVEAVNIYDASKTDASNKRVAIAPSGSGFTATYTANSNWADSTIKFSGTGVAIIEVKTAKGDVELAVEVVEGKNVFAAGDFSGATNYVLMNNITWGTANKTAISGAIYGNGFAINAPTYQPAIDGNTAMFKLSGTIDNLVINGPTYTTLAWSGEANYVAGIYIESGSDAKITNSYISGFREPIMANGTSLYLENTTLKGGNYANLILQTGTLTLNNVTTVQVSGSSGLGLGIVVSSSIDASKVTIIGELNQYNWVTEKDAKNMDSNIKSVVNQIFQKSELVHTVNDTKYVNQGILFQGTGGTVDNATQTNRDKYKAVNVSASLMGSSFEGVVYTQSSSSPITSVPIYGGYVPNTQAAIKPAFEHKLTLTNGVVDLKLVGGSATLTLPDYTVSKYSGQPIAVNITCPGATVEDKKITFAQAGNYTVTYTVEDNWFFNADGTKQEQSVSDSYTVTIVVVKAEHKSAEIDLSGLTYKAGWSVSNLGENANGFDDYSCCFAVLDGLKVYDYKEDGTRFEVTISADNLNGLTVVQNNNAEVDYKIIEDNVYWLVDSKADNNKADKSVKFTYSYTGLNGKPVSVTSSAFVLKSNDSRKGPNCVISSGGSGSGCVTPDTLVTLADGSKVRVDSLTGSELLLVWNMEIGKLDFAPIMFVDSEEAEETEVIRLIFSDGTDVKVVYEHGFWDYDLNKYVYLDEDASEFIGHWFAKQNGDQLEKVQLVDVVIETEMTEAWSPVTQGHLCYFVNGMLSMPGGVGGLFNIFDVDVETMTYDYEALTRDIETYGLFTYEEMNAIVPLSEDMFNMAGGAYLKISIGKGNMTMEDLVYMIQRYSVYFE